MAEAARLDVSDADGRCRVAGPLDFTSAARVAGLGRARISPAAEVVFDLGAVSRADSAGLAVLVEWVREARRQGAGVRFENVPAQLLDLAHAARVEALLAGRAPGAAAG